MAAYAMAFASRSGPAAVPRVRAALAGRVSADARFAQGRSGAVILVVELAEGADPATVAEELRARLTEATGDASLSAGVSAPVWDHGAPRLAMLQAEQALYVGRSENGKGGTVSFDALGPYCYVLGRPARDIRATSRRVLGPLAEDDPAMRDLVRTLEEYLRAHGSVKDVARRLRVHRNTVRLRLRRIARLTGADLSDADTRLTLHLAIIARRALERMAS